MSGVVRILTLVVDRYQVGRAEGMMAEPEARVVLVFCPDLSAQLIWKVTSSMSLLKFLMHIALFMHKSGVGRFRVFSLVCLRMMDGDVPE